jgi:hypothetical protein
MSSPSLRRTRLFPSIENRRALWRDVVASWVICFGVLSILATGNFVSEALRGQIVSHIEAAGSREVPKPT